MTDADLTLRDEVAEVLCAARCGDDAPAAIPEAQNPRWRVAACFVHQREADALLPLLARVRAEADNEARLSEMQGKADSLTGQLIAADAYAKGLAEGEARVRERVEAVLEAEERRCRGADPAYQRLHPSQIRAALAEPDGDAPSRPRNGPRSDEQPESGSQPARDSDSATEGETA